MEEQWKQIKGFNYKVSNFGKVRSLDKFQDFPLFAKGNKAGDKTSLTPVFRKGVDRLLKGDSYKWLT